MAVFSLAFFIREKRWRNHQILAACYALVQMHWVSEFAQIFDLIKLFPITDKAWEESKSLLAVQSAITFLLEVVIAVGCENLWTELLCVAGHLATWSAYLIHTLRIEVALRAVSLIECYLFMLSVFWGSLTHLGLAFSLIHHSWSLELILTETGLDARQGCNEVLDLR